MTWKARDGDVRLDWEVWLDREGFDRFQGCTMHHHKSKTSLYGFIAPSMCGAGEILQASGVYNVHVKIEERQERSE